MNSPFSLVDRFGIDLTPVGPAESVSGGFSGAIILRVPCRSGIFAVRGWPATADSSRLRGLHRLLRHVAAHGVPVAVPLAGADGRALTEHRGRWWQVEPWLPGRADFHESPTDARLAAAMETLAAFHEAAISFEARPEEAECFGGPVFGTPRTVTDRIELMWRVMEERSVLVSKVSAAGGGRFDRLARQAVHGVDRLGGKVLDQLRAFGRVRVPLSPVLRDVWHDHMLFTGDAVTGLVDPSACRRDTVAADLSRLLGSLLGDDAKRWGFAVSAYARCRSLSADEAALVPVLDRSGVVLSAVTWVRRRYLLGEACETREVIDRLRGIVERMEGWR